MFGHLKTIKVWVGMYAGILVLKPRFGLFYQKWLPELEYVSILSEMGKFPGNKVAQMNAAILFRFKTLGKATGIKIIHVLVNPDIRGHKCIQQQKIQIGEKVKALLGNIAVCI
jgi:hypothetical protein